MRDYERVVDTIFKGLCSMRGTLAGHVDWFNSRLTLTYRRTRWTLVQGPLWTCWVGISASNMSRVDLNRVSVAVWTWWTRWPCTKAAISPGCQAVTTSVQFPLPWCLLHFSIGFLSQMVGEAPSAWARPPSQPSPIPGLDMWLFGPWANHFPKASPGQATRSIRGGTDVWLSHKLLWMLRNLYFGQLVGWVLGINWKSISCLHVHCFASVTVNCEGDRWSQSVTKHRSWSKLSCWVVRGLYCVFVLCNTAKKNQTSMANLPTYDSKLLSMNALNAERKYTLTCKLHSILPTGPKYELVADAWSLRIKVSIQHKQQQ